MYRRLDYFFISVELQPYVEETDITPTPFTDHSAVTLHIKSLPGVKNGPSFWKFNNSLINDNNYIQEIKNEINNCKARMNAEGIDCPQLRWDLLKYSKARAKTFRNGYRDIEEKIKKIESGNRWEQDPAKTAEHDSLKKALEEKSNYITEGIILRSKLRWSGMSKAKRIQNTFYPWKNIESFYISQKNTKTLEDCLGFMSSIVSPTLTAEEQASSEGYLTVNECYNALKQLGSSKTPGMYGLTKEFYLAFWDVVHSDLIRCLNKSFEKGTLSTSQQQVVITLLEKPGKDKRLLSSWRLITKIYSKALSNRVCKVITELVDSDQEAFI